MPINNPTGGSSFNASSPPPIGDVASNTVAATTLSTTGGAGAGVIQSFAHNTNASLGLYYAGFGYRWAQTETSVSLGRDMVIGWTNDSNDALASPDLILLRAAANTLALRNGTDAQTLILGQSGVADGELQCSKVTLFGGATISKVLIGTAPSGTTSVGASSYTNVDITVTGAADGDFASVATSGSSPVTSAGLVAGEVLVTTNKVTIVYYNTDPISSHALNNTTLVAIVFKAS